MRSTVRLSLSKATATSSKVASSKCIRMLRAWALLTAPTSSAFLSAVCVSSGSLRLFIKFPAQTLSLSSGASQSNRAEPSTHTGMTWRLTWRLTRTFCKTQTRRQSSAVVWYRPVAERFFLMSGQDSLRRLSRKANGRALTSATLKARYSVACGTSHSSPLVLDRGSVWCTPPVCCPVRARFRPFVTQ